MLATALSILLRFSGADDGALGPNDRLYSFNGIPNVTFVYYDVYGTTPLEIRHYIDNRALLGRSETGRTYGAVTKPHVSWKASTQTDSKGCKITRLDIMFSVEVTLPRLANRASVPEETLRRWDRFMEKLISHEAGHAHNAYDHLEEIRAAIMKGGCAHGNAAGTALVLRDQQRDHEYEVTTDNGHLQGADFP